MLPNRAQGLTHTAMAVAVAVAVAVAARPFSSTSSVLLSRITSPRPKWVILNPLASSSPQPISSSSGVSRKLILYSKPGCCLCDGLKEKLHAAFSLSAPDSLHDVDLQIRDITTNPEWERAYQYEIPVLARVRLDGTEEVLPRLSPRLGVELIQKKIADALRQ